MKKNEIISHEISCGAYIIDDKKVLLIKHKNGGHWDCPKGHMEIGETKSQTAIREVLEETGLEIKIVSEKEYIVSYMPNTQTKKTVIFFEAEKVGGKLKKQESEVIDIKWVSLEDAINIITFEENKKAFKSFLKDKKMI